MDTMTGPDLGDATIPYPPDASRAVSPMQGDPTERRYWTTARVVGTVVLSWFVVSVLTWLFVAALVNMQEDAESKFERVGGDISSGSCDPEYPLTDPDC